MKYGKLRGNDGKYYKSKIEYELFSKTKWGTLTHHGYFETKEQAYATKKKEIKKILDANERLKKSKRPLHKTTGFRVRRRETMVRPFEELRK